MIKIAHPAVQPRPPGADHPRAGRDHRRGRGARIRSERSAVTSTNSDFASIQRCISDIDLEGSPQHGHRDRDRTDRPGDRLDVRRRVRRGAPARDLQRPDGRHRGQGRQDPPDRRGAAAPRRQPRPLRGPGLDRRPGPRHGRSSTPAGRCSVPVGKETLGRVFNLLGEPIDGRGPVARRRALADPPRPARRSTTSRPRPSCSRRASRSSTCSPRSSAAARSACSAGPGWARRSSSPS